jgi:urease accessory protein
MDALLLLLLDSRAPAGGHAHSGGMEAGITAGWVRDTDDLEQFCRGRLATSGRVAAAFAAAACRSTAGWDVLDAEYDARLPSEALREASRAQGRGLRRLVLAMLSDAPPAGHHPLVLGATVALAGGDGELAARAAALNAVTAPASAAVRLLGLDPLAVQAMLGRLGPLVDECAARAATDVELPSDSAPAADLLADVHRTEEVRLFAS